MNKIIFPIVMAGVLAVTSCSSERASNTSANASRASNSNPFAVYDSPSGGPRLATSQAERVDTRTVSNTGGGGGGGGRSDPVPAGTSHQDIPLTQATSSQSDAVPVDRKIIRNAQLGIEAEKPEDLQQRIASIAQIKGGFVVSSQQTGSEPRSNTRDIVEMSVRVPGEKFAETIDEIKAGPGRILTETVKGEDVTEEFIDIDARLRAKKALEQQFMEIMKRANTVEDALNVQRELSDVRSEIEKIEGRRRFIENQASLSTINVRIQAPTVFAAETAGFLDRLSESFGAGFEVALNFVLGLVTFVVGVLPFLVFVGIPGFLVTSAVLRRRNRPMSVSEIAKDEIKND